MSPKYYMPVKGEYRLMVNNAALADTLKLPKENIINVTPTKSISLKEIAEIKLPDLNAYDVEHAMKIVAGTAKNMGIAIEE